MYSLHNRGWGNGLAEMANSLPSHPRSVPVSKWGQRINKHCTSDYWAEEKSACFDRSLFPSLLPPSFYPFSSICPFACLLFFRPRCTSYPSHAVSLLLPFHTFLLHPTLTLIPCTLLPSLHFLILFASGPFPHFLLLLGNIKACCCKILGKYWSRQSGGTARSLAPIQERPGNFAKGLDAELLLLLFFHKVTFLCGSCTKYIQKHTKFDKNSLCCSV